MVSWGKIVRGAAAIAAAAALVSGCNSGNEGDPEPSGASGTSAAPVPGYDPCTQIPHSALDSLQLHGSIPRESSNSGLKWFGCQWVRSDWYAVDIVVTNTTLSKIREQGTSSTPLFVVQDLKSFTVAGRPALSNRQSRDHPDQQCTVNVEIKGGSLEFFLSNPRENRKGGGLDSCQLAQEVAEKVVPTLPAGT
ncbi:DUF3558 domain-containing protein [Nocardia wallacei]|uniref:DUF3558 domain-containing protein n=1 Tax=Nocardia wallacei TaxID=480035 RepID=UPI0024554B48|nr:DUF3558 domain-containing protein [Nocardia wallacei]